MFFRPKFAAQDYSRDMLPHNRREVFFDVLSLHSWKFLLLGAVMLLFALPLHGTAIAEDYYISIVAASVTETTDTVGRLEAALALNSIGNIRAVLDIPLFMLFAVGLSGLMRVARQYAWEENVSLSYDFLLGIRQNGKQTVLLAFLAGVIAFVCQYVRSLSALIEGDGIYPYLGIIPTVLFAILLLPPGAYTAVCIALYKNRLGDNIRLGFVLYFRSVGKTLLACLCGLAVFSVQHINNFYCHLLGRLIASLLIPIVALGWTLFAMEQADRYIHPKYSPELIGRGIVPVAGEGEDID